MSGQDILDQAAGTTDFVHDYLHIDWDGTEGQNDKGTDTVTSVAGNPVTNGIGTVPLDHEILEAEFEDQITPISPATPAFTDEATKTDALTFSGSYKVVFLAFPLEAYGTAAQKADLTTASSPSSDRNPSGHGQRSQRVGTERSVPTLVFGAIRQIAPSFFACHARGLGSTV